MSQHTTGNWYIRREGFSTVYVFSRRNGGLVQEVAACGPTFGYHEQDHNARLIAAAPDLLAALEKMVAVHDEPCRFDHNGYCQSHYLDHQVDGCLVQIARDAIKKARGE